MFFDLGLTNVTAIRYLETIRLKGASGKGGIQSA